jgi:hypothetical protein
LKKNLENSFRVPIFEKKLITMGLGILIAWVFLTGVALWDNYKYNNIYVFSINLNKFNSAYFELGISNRHSHTEGGVCTDTYCLGLYFITFQVDFLNVAHEE